MNPCSTMHAQANATGGRPALWQQSLAAGAVAALVATLAACGGGGGSPTPTAPPAPPDLGAAYTATNYARAATVANDSFVLFDLAQFAGQFVLFGNGWFSNGVSYNCGSTPSDGTFAVNSNNVGGKAKVGERLSLVYTNCVTSGGGRFNGSVTLNLSAVAGDPTTLELNKPWAFTADTSFGNLQLTSSKDRYTFDGTLQVSLDSAGVVTATGLERVTTKMASTLFTVREDADTHAFSSVQGSLFQDYATARDWTASVSLSLQSTLFNGQMKFDTQNQFSGPAAATHPHSGTGRLTGASGHSIAMAASPVLVNLSLATPQTTSNGTLTWAQFLTN